MPRSGCSALHGVNPNLRKRDNVRAQMKFRRDVNSSILENDFPSRTDQPIFTSIKPLLLDRSNETS